MTSNNQEMSGTLLPYTSVYIDAELGDLHRTALECLQTDHDRVGLSFELQNMWTTRANPNPVMPILSVRTGFDLFLRVMNFPAGSEIIMSAINIPDMVRIVRHHKLNIVPLDVSIDTVAPKTHLLPQLLTARTVAIVVAHLYGKWVEMDDIITFAKAHKLYVVEDCAECFCGFDKLSHQETDVALFSFGVIKFYTSFGGAIAKVKPSLYSKMSALYETYPVQKQTDFLKKVLKYVLVYMVLNNTTVNYFGIKMLRFFGYHNFKDSAVKMLRGFPNKMLERIREQPCNALLKTMLKRQKAFSPAEFCLQRLKGDYVAARLSPQLEVVGNKASICNYWLFPVVAEDPDHLTHLLNLMGVEAYRGATQLNIVEPMNGNPEPLLAPNHGENMGHTQSVQEHSILHSTPQTCYKSRCNKETTSIATRCHAAGKSHPQTKPDTTASIRLTDTDGKPELSQYQQLDQPVAVCSARTETVTKEVQPSGLSDMEMSSSMAVCSARPETGTKETQPPGLSDMEMSSSLVPAINHCYPHEAKYLVDHVVYLPVNKLVPFHVLSAMVTVINSVVGQDKNRDHSVQLIPRSKL